MGQQPPFGEGATVGKNRVGSMTDADRSRSSVSFNNVSSFLTSGLPAGAARARIGQRTVTDP
jgi:hypothetical protein